MSLTLMGTSTRLSIFLWLHSHQVIDRWTRLGLTVVAVATLAALMLHNTRSSAFIDFEAYYAGALAVRQGTPLYERALIWRAAGHTIALPNPRRCRSRTCRSRPPARSGWS
jgi:hypothetical protein